MEDPDQDLEGGREAAAASPGSSDEQERKAPATDQAVRSIEDNVTNPDYDNSSEMESDEHGASDHPEPVKRRPSHRSIHEENKEEDGSPEPGEVTAFSEEMPEPPSPKESDQLSPETADLKGRPSIFGRVRRESALKYKVNSEASNTVAADKLQETSQKCVGTQTDRSCVGTQTDRSWLYEHYRKKSLQEKRKQSSKDEKPPEDIYAALTKDVSSLEILCDMEFKEEFLRLFQESLRTLSSVGPPTIIAYRRESARKVFEIKVENACVARCPYCGSLLKDYPTFESLEKIEEYGALFCCQRCRDLYEFLVLEKMRYRKPATEERIDVAPHKAHGTEAERELARERARQRLRERQLAKQIAHAHVPTEDKDVIVTHTGITEFPRQLRTFSFSMSISSGWIIHSKTTPQRGDDITYSISCCDFTIAGGKLLKNIFLEQYYKNGVKFLTMFPDGTAQIFYPSGNLAIIIIKKKDDTGYVCIVQEDQAENPEIQAVFASSGKATCYHPHGPVWINITIRGGLYSDQEGSKVRTWCWSNHLQRDNPRVQFKPIFISLNQNVGVRIVEQEKIAISFLAMGKQAKINCGTTVKLTADHHPWPKFVSEEDLVLFACRIRILRVFFRLHGYVDFPTNDQWAKLEIPLYISKLTRKLMNLCKECEIASTLDDLIRTLANSPS